jgi:phage terminase large subunit
MDIEKMTPAEIDALSKEDLKKIYESFSEEEKQILREKTDMLTKALPYALIARSKTAELKEAYMFGGICAEYCEKFKCAPVQFMEDLKTLEKVFIENSIEDAGISFNEKVYKLPDKLKKKNRENHKKIQQENKKSTGNQMSDALKRAGLVK